MESLAGELAMLVLFQGQRTRAVRAGDEDVAPVQPLRQMVDEGKRAGVRPVQVVQRKQERCMACQPCEEVCELVEERDLRPIALVVQPSALCARGRLRRC